MDEMNDSSGPSTVYRGIRNTSRQIYFEFLVIKTHPPDKFHKGFGFVIQFRVGILMQFVRGSSFDKLEFKINLAESVSYPPPVYGSKVQQLLDVG
jgi:hypothetical protein